MGLLAGQVMNVGQSDSLDLHSPFAHLYGELTGHEMADLH